MRASFILAWRSLVRGHVLTLLLAATLLAHLLLPALVRGDGTAEGWREMYVRAVTGLTYVLIAGTVLVCACSSFAQERARARLALTVVRPAPAFAVAVGKWLALCAVAAAACLLTAVLTVARVPDPPPCMHHYAPTLPSPVETAKEMLEEFLRDPQTKEIVRNASREAALELLVNREVDRYDVIPAGRAFGWPFDPALLRHPDLSVYVNFAAQGGLRTPVDGRFTLAGARVGTVTNCTLAHAVVPLRTVDGARETAAAELCFTNMCRESVMLRPRRDIELLRPGDAFAGNAARAALEMFAATALLAAFGLFLSSALSRPVSVFTSLVAIAVSGLSSSVVEDYPYALDVSVGDRIGLAISRAATYFFSLFGETHPISNLATGACIEWDEVLWSLGFDAVLVPAALLVLAACLVRRRPLAVQS